MYGLGYGIAKAGEGLAQGLLRGRLDRMARDERAAERADLERYRQGAEGRAEELQRIQRMGTALNSAMAAAARAPDTARQDVFGSIYRSFMGPDAEIPAVAFKPNEVAVNFKGMQLKGAPRVVGATARNLAQDPERGLNALFDGIDAGLVSITVPQAPETKTYSLSPGQAIVSETGEKVFELPPAPSTSQGKVYSLSPGQALVSPTGEKIFELPPASSTSQGKAYRLGPGDTLVSQTGEKLYEVPETQEGGSKPLQPKVSDYVAGIKAINGKYQVNAGLGLMVDAEGNITGLDPQAFLAGKRTAYQVIKDRAKTDPSAKQDLKTLQYYYEQIETMLGARQTSPAISPASVPQATLAEVPPTPPATSPQSWQERYNHYRSMGKTDQEAYALTAQDLSAAPPVGLNRMMGQ